MEFGHNLNKHAEGHTSVKIHHQPGGASSFSLGHDGAEDDRWGTKGNNNKSNKVGAPQQQQ